MIHELRMSKPSTLEEFERSSSIKAPWRLSDLRFDNDTLSWKYFDGVPATNFREAHRTVMNACWDGPGHADYYALEYLQHLDEVCQKQDIKPVALALDNLTPVRFCHGDCTLYNILVGKKGVKIFDPGNTYGLNCRELDESKMLQSWDGFGTLMRDLPPIVGPVPFTVTRTHYELLLSHYIRMLPHVDNRCQSFAKRRVFELRGILKC